MRHLVTKIVETNLTVQANHINLIMNKGHQLGHDHRGPDRGHRVFTGRTCPIRARAGSIASTALIVALSGLLFLVFKRKDWL